MDEDDMYFYSPINPKSAYFNKGDEVILLGNQSDNWQFSDFYRAAIERTDGNGNITVINIEKLSLLVGEIQKDVNFKSGIQVSIHTNSTTLPANYIWEISPVRK
ncbi:hypothetical protein [Acetobacter senegalensis]|uniref:hypothetical protein n=1 Tax=Acetobacter senegalensis TaxID=446692 RepID=UPI0012FD0F9F|nr:hypothetical protein [Acetobacter senegalensis]